MAALFKIKNRRKKYHSIYDYLEDFRSHLLRYVLIVIVLIILAFTQKELIFDHILFGPKNADFPTNAFLCSLGTQWDMPQLCINTLPFKLINYELSGQFTLHLMVSLIVALILSFPYLIWELVRFVKKVFGEKTAASMRGMVITSFGLMILGILFAYFVIVPLTINFLIQYEVSEELTNFVSMRSYISTITSLVLLTGLAFELPLVAFILGKIGIVSRAFLKKYRKHAIIVFVVFSAIITPPDVFSQILVAVPLYLLYEVSIRVIPKELS